MGKYPWFPVPILENQSIETYLSKLSGNMDQSGSFKKKKTHLKIADFLGVMSQIQNPVTPLHLRS